MHENRTRRNDVFAISNANTSETCPVVVMNVVNYEPSGQLPTSPHLGMFVVTISSKTLIAQGKLAVWIRNVNLTLLMNY